MIESATFLYQLLSSTCLLLCPWSECRPSRRSWPLSRRVLGGCARSAAISVIVRSEVDLAANQLSTSETAVSKALEDAHGRESFEACAAL